MLPTARNHHVGGDDPTKKYENSVMVQKDKINRK